MSETQPELTTNSYVFQEQPGLRSSVAEAAAILRTAAMTPGHRQPTQSSCCCGFLSLTFLQPMLTKVLENPHLSKTHSLNPKSPRAQTPVEALAASAPDLPSDLYVRDFMSLSEGFPGFTVYPLPTNPFSDVT